MAIATDEAGIQFRTLNSSKGPAVRATGHKRTVFFITGHPTRLENQLNLTLFQQAVDDLTLVGDRVTGVIDPTRSQVRSRYGCVDDGTFLSGLIHVARKLHSWTRRRSGGCNARCAAARVKLPVGA